MILFLQLIFLFILIYFIILLSYSLLRGAPFAVIGKKRMGNMFKLLGPGRGTLLDIGSGDGRIVLYAAKKGFEAYGVEINPLLVLLSKVKIRKCKLINAHILWTDFWRHDCSTYKYITVWGTPHIMKPLQEKLMKELKPGAIVVSNHFTFPNWTITQSLDDAYLYIKQ